MYQYIEFLILNVIHGKELDIEYKKNEIIEMINSFFGYNCINQIKLKVIQEKQLKPKSLKIKKISEDFENKLKIINNDNLKKSLNLLVKAFHEKNN